MIFPQANVFNYQRRLFEIIEIQEKAIDDIKDDLVKVFGRLQGKSEQAELLTEDQTDPELQEQLDRVEQRMEEIEEEADWEDIARNTIVPVAEAVNTQFEAEVRAVSGVSPLRQNELLDNLVQKKIGQQVDLIQTLPRRHFDEIESLVDQALKEGKGPGWLAEQIPRAGANNRFQASRIARDQLGTATSEITKQRHKQAGFKRFVWNTVGDQRVRDEHEALNGDIFLWEQGAPGGIFPGEPIQCRCVAQVVRDEALGKFGFPNPSEEEQLTNLSPETNGGNQ